MVHMSILMWIQVHCNQNTLTVLKFSNFTISDQKICFYFGRVKTLKALEGFELKTNRFVVNALTYCSTLLGNKYGKEKIHKVA